MVYTTTTHESRERESSLGGLIRRSRTDHVVFVFIGCWRYRRELTSARLWVEPVVTRIVLIATVQTEV